MSIQAVLDKIPSAKIIERIIYKYIHLKADVYNIDIKMGLLSQCEQLKVLYTNKFVEETKEEIKKQVAGMQTIHQDNILPSACEGKRV